MRFGGAAGSRRRLGRLRVVSPHVAGFHSSYGNRRDDFCGFAFVYGRELSDEFNCLVSVGFVGNEIADDGRLPIGVARDPNIPAYPTLANMRRSLGDATGSGEGRG